MPRATPTAIADYDKAIRIDSNDGIAHHDRGMWNLEEHDRAIADYDEAIRLRPDYAPAYNNRGNSWGRQGDFDRYCRL